MNRSLLNRVSIQMKNQIADSSCSPGFCNSSPRVYPAGEKDTNVFTGQYTYEYQIPVFFHVTPDIILRTTIYHSAIHHLVVNSTQFPPGDAR